MTKKFQDQLSMWLEIKRITRSDLIAQLQLYDYDNFKGLDPITLSRWMNGKTTPPIYKQMLIGRCLGCDMTDFIMNIDVASIKSPNKKAKIVSEFIKLLDYINPTLSYKNSISETKICVDIFDYYQHIELLGDFYKNILPTKSFIEKVYKLENTLIYPTLRIMNDNNELIGHWASVEPIEKLKHIEPLNKLTEKELNEGYLLHVALFQSSRHFFHLISIAICYYFLDPRFKKKRTAYIFLSGYSVYEVTKLVFDAEDFKYYPPAGKNSQSGIYLIKVDILKIASNPLILPLIKERLKCLSSCNDKCNLCNLKSYYSHG